VTKAISTFHNYVNAPKQMNGSSKSKTLLFIFQNVLCLIISYSYFCAIMNAKLISMKDGNLCQKVGHVWEKRTCSRPLLLYKFLNASSDLCLCSEFPANQSFLKQKSFNLILKPYM